MKGELVLALTLTFLVGMLTVAYEVQPVKSGYIWTQTISILADGSISPSSAPIQRNGDVYTLTQNITVNASASITSALNIERNDTILDGAGHALQGPGTHTYPGGGTGIWVSSRVNVTIRNIQVEAFYTGFMIANYCFNCTIEGANVAGNDQGIYVWGCRNITISGNTVTGGSQYGIGLEYCQNNTIIGSRVATNGLWGIGLRSNSQSNSILNNDVEKNGLGILFNTVLNNTVSENNIVQNGEGIRLLGSNGSRIYHNNFDRNTNQVLWVLGSTNAWDNGYPSGGNYWSDYLARYPNSIEIDSSGIWNTSYVIDASNTDHYPLMNQPVIPEFSTFLVLPLMMMATLLAVILFKRKQSAKAISV